MRNDVERGKIPAGKVLTPRRRGMFSLGGVVTRREFFTIPEKLFRTAVLATIAGKVAVDHRGQITNTAGKVADVAGAVNGFLAKGAEGIQNAVNGPLTSEQQYVEEVIFEKAESQNKLIPVLKVVGRRIADESGIRFVSVPQYNSPRIYSDDTGKNRTGENLIPGENVTDAVVVWGDNVDQSQNAAKHSYWLAFKSRNDPESDPVFVPADYFSGPNGQNIFQYIEDIYHGNAYEVRPEVLAQQP